MVEEIVSKPPPFLGRLNLGSFAVLTATFLAMARSRLFAGGSDALAGYLHLWVVDTIGRLFRPPERLLLLGRGVTQESSDGGSSIDDLRDLMVVGAICDHTQFGGSMPDKGSSLSDELHRPRGGALPSRCPFR